MEIGAKKINSQLEFIADRNDNLWKNGKQNQLHDLPSLKCEFVIGSAGFTPQKNRCHRSALNYCRD